MSSLKFKRFTKPHALKRIGRRLLGRFFNQFHSDLSDVNIKLPDEHLDDDKYFLALSEILMSPEGLPPNLNEALFAIDEMATEDGQERLELAIADANLDIAFDEESTHEDIALQVWLENPELLTKKHNEQRLLRISAFEHYGSKEKAPTSQIAVDGKTLNEMTKIVDQWCVDHNRGSETTRIETYNLHGEYWFLIHHGDTYTRTSKIESSKRDVIHYRPEKDSVVVYSPKLNELRINAGPKSEKDLYRENFGFYLFGSGTYFSEKNTYTLEPLRIDGPDALTVHDIDGIKEIRLRMIEIFWGGPYSSTTIRRADDLFADAVNRPTKSPIPEKGKLMKASFEVIFDGSEKSRKVEIRVPNKLKLGRHWDAHLVNQWLSLRCFRTAFPGKD